MLNAYVKCVKSGTDAFTVRNVYVVDNGLLYGNPGYSPSDLEQDINYATID